MRWVAALTCCPTSLCRTRCGTSSNSPVRSRASWAAPTIGSRSRATPIGRIFASPRWTFPPSDQALSALIEDLHARGLLDSTLIVAAGEFGRTPKVNPGGGRDHWPDCYTAVLAGGGVQGGAVYGASDRQGAYPALDPVTP